MIGELNKKVKNITDTRIMDMFDSWAVDKNFPVKFVFDEDKDVAEQLRVFFVEASGKIDTLILFRTIKQYISGQDISSIWGRRNYKSVREHERSPQYLFSMPLGISSCRKERFLSSISSAAGWV